MRLRRRDADLQKPLREGKADRSVQGGLSRFITSRDRRNAGKNPSRTVRTYTLKKLERSAYALLAL